MQRETEPYLLPDLQGHCKLKTWVLSEIWLYVIYGTLGADTLGRKEKGVAVFP